MNVPFSILMSVYKNDLPEYFRTAVESVTLEQTIKPSEVVIVVDGPVSQNLDDTICQLSDEIPTIKLVRMKENSGLGNALRVGLLECSHELVARMDADDISVKDRFERQLQFMSFHPDIAVSGGQIEEFIGDPDNIVSKRRVPLGIAECRRYYQDRDPLNHMTVMFRKTPILEAGGYLPWHLNEDTYLWGRLLLKGYHIANLPQTLVKVRVGENMYLRRGGWKYFQSDMSIVKWKLDNNLTSRGKYIYNYVARLGVEVILPNSLRGWVYKHILR